MRIGWRAPTTYSNKRATYSTESYISKFIKCLCTVLRFSFNKFKSSETGAVSPAKESFPAGMALENSETEATERLLPVHQFF